MIQAAKIIRTGLATTVLIGAGVGIGVVFGALILGLARNPSLREQLFSYATIGFEYAGYWIPCALTLLIFSMFFWFGGVISEGTYIGNNTSAVQKGLNMRVVLCLRLALLSVLLVSPISLSFIMFNYQAFPTLIILGCAFSSPIIYLLYAKFELFVSLVSKDSVIFILLFVLKVLLFVFKLSLYVSMIYSGGVTNMGTYCLTDSAWQLAWIMLNRELGYRRVNGRTVARSLPVDPDLKEAVDSSIYDKVGRDDEVYARILKHLIDPRD